jgi:hypothetical protein
VRRIFPIRQNLHSEPRFTSPAGVCDIAGL